MKVIIAPSLLSADAGKWGEEIKLISGEGLTCLHLDIMDGKFVPNLTYGPGPVAMLRQYSDIEYDAHLMVTEPERLIPAFAAAKVDGITVHYEACPHLHRTLEQIREYGIKAGVAINPGTKVDLLEPVLPYLDRVLVMTVNPGFGGQKAILPVLNKLDWLHKQKAQGLKFQIQADGGVNKENITEFLDAGVENLVIGSALFQPNKTKDNIRDFQTLISSYVTNKTGL